MVITGRKIAWGLAGLVAAGAGLIVLAIALLPYGMAESGQHSYIASHQREILLGELGGLALLGLAVYCFRQIMEWKPLGITFGVVVALLMLFQLASC